RTAQPRAAAGQEQDDGPDGDPASPAGGKRRVTPMMHTRGERAIAVTALKAAVPYIRMFKRKVFVIKAGGAVFGDEECTRELIEQLGILHEVGIHVVPGHGGGPQSTELAQALDVPAQFVEGRRVTDARSLQVATMVL